MPVWLVLVIALAAFYLGAFVTAMCAMDKPPKSRRREHPEEVHQ